MWPQLMRRLFRIWVMHVSPTKPREGAPARLLRCTWHVVSLQLPVEALHYHVRLGVVGGRLLVADSQGLAHALPRGTGELGTLVRSNGSWHPEMCHPVGHKGVCYYLRCFRRQRDRFSPSISPVNHCHQVGVALCFPQLQPHQVHVHMRKLVQGYWDCFHC